MIHLENEFKNAFYSIERNYAKMNMEEKALFIRNWSDNNMAHRRRNILELFVYMELPKYFSKMVKKTLEPLQNKEHSEEIKNQINSIYSTLDGISSDFFKYSISIRSNLQFFNKNIDTMSTAFKEKGEFNKLMPQVIDSLHRFLEPLNASDRIIQRDIVPLTQNIKLLLESVDVEDTHELIHFIDLVAEADWEEAIKNIRHYSYNDLDLIGFNVDL